MRGVKLCAYMWPNGLHGVKRGLKWAIFQVFGTLQGPKKKAPIGLKMGLCHLFVHPKWSTITFVKSLCQRVFDRFLVPKRPDLKVFGYFSWAKAHHHRLKTG